LAYEGGLFQHAVASAWAAANAKDPDEAMWRAFRARPAPRSARDLGVELPWFDDWVAHQAGDEAYWQTDRYARLRSAHRRASVPIFYIAGWYDFFLEGQLGVFDELPTRHRSRLLIGPSGHVGQRGDLPMSGDFGLKFLVPEILAWLDHHLRGARPPEPARGVTTYVVGGGNFVHRDRWPPETTPLPFYLQPADASIDCPRGQLGSEPVAQRQGLIFTYDPANPVPSRGGSKSLWAELGGPSFQDEPCQRDDIVTFLSEPLESPLHIAGAVEVRLIVASDRPDTTFVSRLSESREDGATYLVRERATTLGFRNGSRARQPYEPGRPVELVMRMAPIERVIPAGARLRLDVTSSSFPAFHVHPNHAGPWHVAGSAVRAEQTVQVGGADGPRVLLPVLAE
jgi:putative CocE/NonD family hydrolase